MAPGNSHLCRSPRCDVSLRNPVKNELAVKAQDLARASTQSSLFSGPEAPQETSSTPGQLTEDFFK